jgi:hypothetical protein
MNNNKKKKSLHCPEVESLMNGKMPFVTRHGVTIVVVTIIVVIVMFLLSDGTPKDIMQNIIYQTIEQLKSKFY